MAEIDKVFAGLIPKFYDMLMVPLVFEAYAVDMAELVAAPSPGPVLETAAGSDVVTRALAYSYYQRPPLRNEIKACDANALQLATDRTAQGIASRHVGGPGGGQDPGACDRGGGVGEQAERAWLGLRSQLRVQTANPDLAQPLYKCPVFPTAPPQTATSSRSSMH
jgi:hypothetical protein